ncbi:MAG: transcriptional regulator, partial [Tissierellia bacterium]|nr:transcriptional regulator [Tissierellia bacterium]
MQFYEKLDFLMNITNTSNSVLGQKIKLDPSYISRLRRGQRNALKDENIIASMAEYFANHCMADYQLKSVSDALNNSKTIIDFNELQPLIAKWLSNEKISEVKAVGSFMDNFIEINTDLKIPDKIVKTVKQKDTPTIFPQGDISVYYGVEGKRQAAEFFLLEVMNMGTPQTLLLYSDESTDWMTADRDFAVKWAQLMIGVLSKGNKIKIIHTISRDLDEMLNAIQQWIPMYMTGLIEPYYYPKKRDG